VAGKIKKTVKEKTKQDKTRSIFITLHRGAFIYDVRFLGR
jgi:hypothetical protein